MKYFDRAQMKRISQALEDYIDGWTALDEKEARRHKRVFMGLVTRKQAASWRESAHREKHRKLPMR